MNISQLNFDHIPPLHVPFRFFLAAPLFGLIAAVALLLSGPDTFSGRWQPALLGITHLLSLGVLGMVMVGALFQVLPVIGAAPIRHAGLLAWPVHLLLACGALSLGIGLTLQHTSLLSLAVGALALAFVLFLPAFFRALRQVGQQQVSLHNIGLAGVSLLITVVLGMRQLLAWVAPDWAGLDRMLTDLHAGWGLLGWCLLLIIGVSYQVVPMFHVTPAFPRYGQRLLGPVQALLLVLLTLLVFSAGPDMLSTSLFLLVAVAPLIYSVQLLRCLQQRKRKVADASIRCWQLAAVSLPLAAVLLVTGHGLAAAVLFLYGFVLTVIEGMLLKIIPFLVHLHLQQRCGLNMAAFAELPHMHEILPAEQGRWQFYLHGGALALLLLCTGLPVLTPLAGLLMLAEFAWLLRLMVKGARLYRVRNERIRQLLDQGDSLSGSGLAMQ